MPFFADLLNSPIIFLVSILAFLLALSVHECAHALAAFLLGDRTAQRLGRLTLNPAAHVDTLGLIMLFLVGFGWGKPVPYNPYNLKWPKWGPVVVGIAGPFSNLLLTLFTLLLILLLVPHLGFTNLLSVFLFKFLQLNMVLMLFNLIPLPPLDGSSVLLALLAHPKYLHIREFIERSGPTILIGLVILDSFGHIGVFSWLFDWPMQIVSNILSTYL